MKTAIRMDDITPDMDFEKFYRVKKLLDTYQIKPLIGVVPFNQDSNLMKNPLLEDFPGFLKSLKEDGYVIALHGCYHVYTTDKKGLFPLNNFSEYAGISYEKQNEMICRGKARLREGLVFYPIAAKRSECFSDKKGYTTLVLHTNMMEEKDFETLEKQLQENHEKFISYSEYLDVSAVKRGPLGNMAEYMMALTKYVLVRLRES